MVVSLGADVDVVFDDLHVSPADNAGVCVQSAKVCEFAVLADFNECNTIGMAHNAELAALLGSPSPDVVASFSGGTQVFVGDEVQKVDILARVLASKAVLALCCGGSLLVLLVAIEGTARSSLLPRLQLELHHVFHSCCSSHGSGAEQASSEGSGELHFIRKKGKGIPHKFRGFTGRTLRAILYSEWAYYWCFLGDIAAPRLESWKAVQHVTYLLEPAELI